jgi:hypothetical protein
MQETQNKKKLKELKKRMAELKLQMQQANKEVSEKNSKINELMEKVRSNGVVGRSSSDYNNNQDEENLGGN